MENEEQELRRLKEAARRRANSTLVWVPNPKKRFEELKADHETFLRENPDFYKGMVPRRRRPRIKAIPREPKKVIIRRFGDEVAISYADFQRYCDEETIVIRKVY